MKWIDQRLREISPHPPDTVRIWLSSLVWSCPILGPKEVGNISDRGP